MILTDAEIRIAYNHACHGASAAERWHARDAIQDHLRETGASLAPLLTRLGLDITAYFASRPITRPKVREVVG